MIRAIIAMAAATVGIAMATSALTGPHEISGPSRVIDGDTVVVGDVHVRLKGVDAAERGTERGDIATEVMIAIVGDSELTCQLTGEHTWKREVGFCFTSDGTDINRAIVEQGAALSCPRYSTRYLPYEQAEALAAAAGLVLREASPMTAIVLIAALLLGALGWAGRRPRRTYPDQTTSIDAGGYGGDFCCDDGCASDSDDIACDCGDDSSPASGDRDD